MSTDANKIDRPLTSVTIQTVGLNNDGTLFVEACTVQIQDLDPSATAVGEACERAMLGIGFHPENVKEVFRG